VRCPEDMLIWHWKKDENYSVRSAHCILCEERIISLTESSNGTVLVYGRGFGMFLSQKCSEFPVEISI